MFSFPYGNLHGLNLDWLLAEWKKFKTSFTNAFTASTTQLPVSSAPQIDVTYDADTGIYNFDFGIPAEVKPQSFQIGYAESSSGTVIPTGITWLANPPAVAQGNYLWSRTMVIYNDGSYSATYACSRMGVDGAGTPATTTPLMDGVGDVGTSLSFAREDHVHPTDTALLNAINNKGRVYSSEPITTFYANVEADEFELFSSGASMTGLLTAGDYSGLAYGFAVFHPGYNMVEVLIMATGANKIYTCRIATDGTVSFVNKVTLTTV